MNQVIPNTERMEVAMLAAALYLAVPFDGQVGYNVSDFDHRLERFEKAYKKIKELSGYETPESSS